MMQGAFSFLDTVLAGPTACAAPSDVEGDPSREGYGVWPSNRRLKMLGGEELLIQSVDFERSRALHLPPCCVRVDGYACLVSFFVLCHSVTTKQTWAIAASDLN